MRSLRAKLVRTMVAMVVIVASGTFLVVAVMNYVTARRTLSTIESHLRDNLRRKGSELVTGQSLALRDLVADNAFGDVARLIERTVEGDEDIAYGVFLGEDGNAWGFASRLATPSGPKPKEWNELGITPTSSPSAQGHSSATVVLGEAVFEFQKPVVDDKGTALGTLRYALSHHSLQLALTGARGSSRQALITTIAVLALLGGGATMLGFAFSRRAASRITQPLGDLTTAAKALAQGRRDIRVSIESGDELQLLGTAFNDMVTEIRDYTVRLEDMNRGLESKVEERTQALGAKNRDMRLVLDNVAQGLVTLSPDGRLAQERSAIIDRWFGTYGPDTRFTDYIAAIDPVYAETFALAYQAVWEDVLPLELCLEQLPRRLRQGDSVFQFTYLPLGNGQRPEGLLLVIDDISEQLRAARQEAERTEMLALFEGCNKDRLALFGFVDETNDLLARLSSADVLVQKRLLHTIKGNAGLMGLVVVARVCHELEDLLSEGHRVLGPADLSPLVQRWAHLTGSLDSFVGGHNRDVVEVPVEELDRLDQEIRLGMDGPRLIEMVLSLKLEPAERPLRRLANHARALAGRLGKGPLEVVVDGGGVRLPPRVWAGLWSDLVHVVRNAVDHGVEPVADRHNAGKAAPATLRLATRVAEGRIVVEIEDDGAGIDWAAIKRAAFQRGFPHETQDDLVRAMFAPEVSTRSDITTLSGRGIGLAAVEAQVRSLGGTAHVRSRLGEGTCFTFTFPVPEAADGRGSENRPRASGGHSAVA